MNINLNAVLHVCMVHWTPNFRRFLYYIGRKNYVYHIYARRSRSLYHLSHTDLEPWPVVLLMYYRTTQMVKMHSECNDNSRSREDEATRVQLTVPRLWHFADCPIWALASVLVLSGTFVLPSEEEDCDVYCTYCLSQCCGNLTGILARHLTEKRSGLGVVRKSTVCHNTWTVWRLSASHITDSIAIHQFYITLDMTSITALNFCGFPIYVSFSSHRSGIATDPRELAALWHDRSCLFYYLFK